MRVSKRGNVRHTSGDNVRYSFPKLLNDRIRELSKQSTGVYVMYRGLLDLKVSGEYSMPYIE